MPEPPDMLAQAGALGDQLRHARAARPAATARGPFRDVLLAGLGGSAAGARLAAGLLQERLQRARRGDRRAWRCRAGSGPHTPRRRDLLLRRDRRGARLVAARPAERGATRVARHRGRAAGRRRGGDGRRPASACRAGSSRAARSACCSRRCVVLLDEAGAAPGAAAELEPAAAAADRVPGRERRGRRRRRAVAARRRTACSVARSCSTAPAPCGPRSPCGSRTSSTRTPRPRPSPAASPRSPTTRCWAGRARCGPACRLAAVLLRDPGGDRRASAPSPTGWPTSCAPRATRCRSGRATARRRSSAPSGCCRSATTSPAGWASASASTWGRSIRLVRLKERLQAALASSNRHP